MRPIIKPLSIPEIPIEHRVLPTIQPIIKPIELPIIQPIIQPIILPTIQPSIPSVSYEIRNLLPIEAKPVESKPKKVFKPEPVFIIPHLTNEKENILIEYYDPIEKSKNLRIPKEYKVLPPNEIVKEIYMSPLGYPYYKFLDKDTVINVDDPKRDYHSRKYEPKNAFGWGQRKLGLALIQFLSLYLNPKITNPQIVYAGAATGENIALAAKLFTTKYMKPIFHLYDPRAFNISGPNVFVYNGDISQIKPEHNIILYTGDTYGWFTDEIAKEWSNKQSRNKNVYFLSDIRSVDHEKQNLEEFELGVWRDMVMQANWHKIIKPVKSQLKFRLPYDVDNILKIFPDRKVPYLQGIIYKGIYSKPTSTESRLVPVDNDYNDYLYDFKDYESKLFYFNTEIKEKRKYLNPLGMYDPLYSPELLNDYNSTAEIWVWIKYLEKMGLTPTEEHIRKLSDLLSKTLGTKTLNSVRKITESNQ